jgi:dolichol-phosphate mannosyltransferase
MKLSIIIPAFNESLSLPGTVKTIFTAFSNSDIDYEILVVNDNSTDGSLEVLDALSKETKNFRYITNKGPNGFGNAIKTGLDNYTGECVALMMADLSDSPHDLINFYHEMVSKDLDCVFGSRFTKHSLLVDYPPFKKLVNRIVNQSINILFNIKYNDVTNAFKLYKRSTIEGVQPLLSAHFNLTMELPLKVIIKGYQYTVLPNSWTNRKLGESKLNLKKMAGLYFKTFILCLKEKYYLQKSF